MLTTRFDDPDTIDTERAKVTCRFCGAPMVQQLRPSKGTGGLDNLLPMSYRCSVCGMWFHGLPKE